jgi:hypothetical protein
MFLQSIPRVLISISPNVNTPGITFDGPSLMTSSPLSSELVRAARALLRWEQRDLAQASAVSLPTIKRLEAKPGMLASHLGTASAIKSAFERAGIEFIDENGGGPGVRLRKTRQTGKRR